MLLYFTSGTTAKPKLVLHSHRSYPVGASVDDVLARPAAGRRASEHLLAGLGQARLELLLRAVECRRHVFVVNQPRFDAKALLATIGRCGVTTLCAPPTVWRMFIQEDLRACKVACARSAAPASRSTRKSSTRCSAAWGLTIRDGYGQTETTALVGNSPGQKVKLGSMGRPLPGYRVRSPMPTATPTKEGEVAWCSAPTGRPA